MTSPGFIVQDAFASWKLDDAFILEAGHFLVPLSRNILQSTLSFYTLDISPTSTVMAGPTQTNGLRDNGVQAKGTLVDGGRLEYRAAVFQGVRDSASRNPFRTAAYLQYNFFEKEKGYVFAGTNLGKKKTNEGPGPGRWRLELLRLRAELQDHGAAFRAPSRRASDDDRPRAR